MELVMIVKKSDHHFNTIDDGFGLFSEFKQMDYYVVDGDIKIFYLNFYYVKQSSYNVNLTTSSDFK